MERQWLCETDPFFSSLRLLPHPTQHATWLHGIDSFAFLYSLKYQTHFYDIKDFSGSIKVCGVRSHWPLCGEFTDDQWIPRNSSHKGPVTRKMFPFDDIIMVSPRSFVSIYLCYKPSIAILFLHWAFLEFILLNRRNCKRIYTKQEILNELMK